MKVTNFVGMNYSESNVKNDVMTARANYNNKMQVTAQSVPEKIFKSIDIICKERLKGLSFNTTVTCKIANNDNAAQGEYIVQDGDITYKAYSDRTDFQLGTYVYVMVPNSDYDKQKIILGKQVNDKTESFVYIPPTLSYLDITGNILSQSNKEYGLTANGEKKTLDILQIKDKTIWSDFNQMKIGATFISQLANSNVVSGDYGIQISLISNSATTRFQFGSNLFKGGNPYAYEIGQTQEWVFDIGSVGEISEIYISLFQNQNFKNGDGENIPSSVKVQSSEPIWGWGPQGNKKDKYEDLPPNIKVKDLTLSFGYNSNSFKENSLVLYTLGEKKYRNHGELSRTIYCKFLELNENNTFVVKDKMEETDVVSNKVRLHWYKHSIGSKDSLAGDDWEEIAAAQQQMQYSCALNVNQELDRIKAIMEFPSSLWITGELNQDTEYIKIPVAERSTSPLAQTIVANYMGQIRNYESSPLIFINESAPSHPADTSDVYSELEAQLKLSVLNCDTGFDYNFFNAENNGRMIDEQESEVIHSISLKYLNANSSVDVNTKYFQYGLSNINSDIVLDEIKWYIPRVNSMFVLDEQTAKEDKLSWDTAADYYVGTQKKASMSNGGLTACFKIKPMYLHSFTENTRIYCEFSYNNKIYHAIANFSFEEKSPTKATFKIILGNEEYFSPNNLLTNTIYEDGFTIYNNDDTTQTCYYEVYDDYNKNITNDFELQDVSWYASTSENVLQIKDQGRIIRAIGVTESQQQINKYAPYILKLNFKNKKFNYYHNEFYPICVKTSGVLHYRGFTSVYYNSLGVNPSFNNLMVPELYPSSGYTINTNSIEWNLIKVNANGGGAQDIISAEKNGNLIKEFFMKHLYISNLTEHYYIHVKCNLGEVLQPIFIGIKNDTLQGNIVYDNFSSEANLKNLTLFQKNDTIISAMWGVSTFQKNNSILNGILFGQKDNAYGLYGFSGDKTFFSLTTEGTFSLGEATIGQLSFSSTNSLKLQNTTKKITLSLKSNDDNFLSIGDTETKQTIIKMDGELQAYNPVFYLNGKLVQSQELEVIVGVSLENGQIVLEKKTIHFLGYIE